MIAQAIGSATPIILAALGGLFTELAGCLNIALEGLMSTGSFAALVTAGSLAPLIHGPVQSIFAVIAGGLAGGVAGLALAGITFSLRANLFITGLGFNLLAGSIISLLSEIWFGTKGVVRFQGISVLGPLGDGSGIAGIILSQNALTLFMWAVIPLYVLLMIRTPFGLRLRAAGGGPETLLLRGGNPSHSRYAALVLSGVFCGIAGASLSLSLGSYVPGGTAGKGWIALAAIFLGRRNPVGVIISSCVFAISDSGALVLQRALNIPHQAALGLPYFLTLMAFAFISFVQWFTHRTLRTKREIQSIEIGDTQSASPAGPDEEE